MTDTDREAATYARRVLDGYNTLTNTESWLDVSPDMRMTAGEIRNLAAEVLHPEDGDDMGAQADRLCDLMAQMPVLGHMDAAVAAFKRVATELHTHLDRIPTPD